MRLMRDRPVVVTSAAAVVVTLHWLAALVWDVLDIWLPLRGMAPEDVSVLYLGLAGLGAASAGFAGVIVIFGLEGHSRKFLTFRVVAGRSLRANWLSVVATSFVATGLALLATTLAFLRHPGLAPWLFELAVLLLFHACARLVWLLSALMRVVASEDAAVAREERKLPLDSIVRKAAS